MPAISSSACSIVPPYFQISRAEELHDLGRRRDRVAAEELAAGEDRRRRAHVVAVHGELVGAGPGRTGSRVRGSRSGCVAAPTRRRRRRRARCPRRPRRPSCRTASGSRRGSTPGRMPEPAREQPEHHRVLGLLGARGLLRHLADRDGDRLPRASTAGQRQLVGSDAGLRCRRRPSCRRPPAARRRTSGSPPSSAPPRRRACPPGLSDRVGRQPHAARRLAAADLRAEALGQQRVVALAAPPADMQRVAGARRCRRRPSRPCR